MRFFFFLPFSLSEAWLCEDRALRHSFLLKSKEYCDPFFSSLFFFPFFSFSFSPFLLSFRYRKERKKKGKERTWWFLGGNLTLLVWGVSHAHVLLVLGLCEGMRWCWDCARGWGGDVMGWGMWGVERRQCGRGAVWRVRQGWERGIKAIERLECNGGSIWCLRVFFLRVFAAWLKRDGRSWCCDWLECAEGLMVGDLESVLVEESKNGNRFWMWEIGCRY